VAKPAKFFGGAHGETSGVPRRRRWTIQEISGEVFPKALDAVSQAQGGPWRVFLSWGMLGYPLNRSEAFTGDFWRFGRGEIPGGRRAVFSGRVYIFSGDCLPAAGRPENF